jgi:hypothetical protein
MKTGYRYTAFDYFISRLTSLVLSREIICNNYS